MVVVTKIHSFYAFIRVPFPSRRGICQSLITVYLPSQFSTFILPSVFSGTSHRVCPKRHFSHLRPFKTRSVVEIMPVKHNTLLSTIVSCLCITITSVTSRRLCPKRQCSAIPAPSILPKARSMVEIMPALHSLHSFSASNPYVTNSYFCYLSKAMS